MSFAGSLAAAQALGAGSRPRSNSVGGTPTGGPLRALQPHQPRPYAQPVLVDGAGHPISMAAPMAQSGFMGSSMFVHAGAPMITQTPGMPIIPATTDPCLYLASVIPAYYYQVAQLARPVNTGDLASVLNFWSNAEAVDAAIQYGLPANDPRKPSMERALNDICLPKVQQTESRMQKLSEDVDCAITAKKLLAGISAILCFVAGLGLLAGIFTFCAPAIFIALMAVGLTAGVALWAYGSVQENKHVQDVCDFALDKCQELAPQQHHPAVSATARPPQPPPAPAPVPPPPAPDASHTAPAPTGGVAAQPAEARHDADAGADGPHDQPAPATAAAALPLPPPSSNEGDHLPLPLPAVAGDHQTSV